MRSYSCHTAAASFVEGRSRFCCDYIIVFVPNFSSISRPSCSQFACWLPISWRPILGQCLWWDWQYLHPFDSVSGIIWHNLSHKCSKFRKPYKGNQFSSNSSETVGPILVILLADPHENWMLMKCWKNQPSSTSAHGRVHLSLRAQTFISSVAHPIAKILGHRMFGHHWANFICFTYSFSPKTKHLK